ncbi:uncharacterized protein At4g26450-like isoform X1 [Phoenix dactylifera]|uniref:Uncharacterized protein At4g26450-like isoform X1 n=1 Tax=Phoenix dactylifera TaxID=42345 RepID=A0A8B9ASV3_PHODC|nr:uncharacterized protein At4g26450-like isoform X1 [Phoenix dactylifera]
MQERHRSPAPRRISPESPVRGQRKFKPYSNYRNFQRRSFDGDQPKRCSDSPPQKTDVWIEAGRLAAEYLVSKGLLSPSLLPGQSPRKEDNKVLKEKERDSLVPESRTSAFARLGNAFPEVGHGRRRRNDDDHDRMGSRNYLRRRMGHYSRGQGSNWLRDNVRNARWIERSSRYSNSGDEDNDLAPHFHRSRWSGFDKGRGSAMRSPADEGYSRSDRISQLRSEKEDVDEIRSKVSSSRVKRDRSIVSRWDLNEGDDDGTTFNSVNADELKSDSSSDLKKKDIAVEDRPRRMDDNNLWNVISPLKVPKKPRSSVRLKSPKFDQVDQGPTTEAKITLGATAKEAFKVALEEDLDMNIINSSKCHEPVLSAIQSVQPAEESVKLQYQSIERPSGLGTFRPIVDMREEVSFVQCSNETEGIKHQRHSSSSRIAQENEHSCLHGLSAKPSNPYDENLSLVKEMVDVAEPEKLEDPVLLPKNKSEVNVMLEEEKQLPHSSCRNFDLNIIETPEITEIPDVPTGDHLHTSLPALETEKKLPIYPGFLMGNTTNADYEHRQLVNNEKVIEVINVEDESPAEDNVCNHLKSNETIYSGLDNFLSHTAHVDLSGIQDGCSFSVSNYLATATLGHPSTQPNLSDLPTGMSPHDAVAIPVDDDPIYMSLEEIPFGYVGALD